MGHHVRSKVMLREEPLSTTRYLTLNLGLLIVRLKVIGHVHHPFPAHWTHSLLDGVVLGQMRLHLAGQRFRLLALHAHQLLAGHVLLEEMVQQLSAIHVRTTTGNAKEFGLREEK